MSQSPTESSTTAGAQLDRYQQGWKALNRLLHEDRSFSGGERHCAFLNTASGSFADVSAVTGFNFDDDGRALAVCDWDFDGQLDLWVTNRTSPRIRFLRNQHPPSAHFIAIKLEGNGQSTNRDAIGARVEIFGSDRSTPTHMKTLHAGDAFLSQSSHWLHFGLGDDPALDRVIIHWPDGSQESLLGIKPDGFYHVAQGSPQAQVWIPPGNRRPILPSPQQAVVESDRARVVLPARLPLPAVQVTRPAQRNASSELDTVGPLLINVWSSTCVPCLEELGEFTARSEEFRAKGLKIVALNADPTASDTALAARTEQIMVQLGFPFDWYWTDEESVRKLDYYQRAMMDRWQPLPVPCSILVDAQGRAAVIYKGVADVDQVFEDLKLLSASPTELRRAAVPFAGRWISDVAPPDPLRVVSQMVDHAQVDSATEYLMRYAAALTANPSGASETQAGDIYYVCAVLLKEQGKNDQALSAYEKSRELNPRDFRVRSDLGQFLGQLGRFDEAIAELSAAVQINPADTNVRRRLGMALLTQQQFDKAIEQFQAIIQERPGDALAHFYLANAFGAKGNHDEAIEYYRLALRRQPNLMLAANNLAWMLATTPNDDLRDGREAVELAEKNAKATEYRQPQLLGTLAAAYAEAGDFENAVRIADQAIELLEKAGRSQAEIEPFRARRTLFAQGKPFRQ